MNVRKHAGLAIKPDERFAPMVEHGAVYVDIDKLDVTLIHAVSIPINQFLYIKFISCLERMECIQFLH